jgi:hypothetical protein
VKIKEGLSSGERRQAGQVALRDLQAQPWWITRLLINVTPQLTDCRRRSGVLIASIYGEMKQDGSVSSGITHQRHLAMTSNNVSH